MMNSVQELDCNGASSQSYKDIVKLCSGPQAAILDWTDGHGTYAGFCTYTVRNPSNIIFSPSRNVMAIWLYQPYQCRWPYNYVNVGILGCVQSCKQAAMCKSFRVFVAEQPSVGYLN